MSRGLETAVSLWMPWKTEEKEQKSCWEQAADFLNVYCRISYCWDELPAVEMSWVGACGSWVRLCCPSQTGILGNLAHCAEKWAWF